MKTIEEIIKDELTPRTIKWWGDTYEDFKPELIDRIFGNGQRLFYLTPLNTRPYYYVVRCDSEIPDIDDDDAVKSFTYDVIDEIREQFGDIDDDDDNDEDNNSVFPMLSLDCGFIWGWEDGEDWVNGDT